MIIKLEHGGKSYAYDDESLTVVQGVAVEEHIKGTLIDFDRGLGRHRSACFQALGWLVFRSGDPDVPIASVDFPIAKLSTAWLQARLAVVDEMKAAVAEAEADAAGAVPPEGGVIAATAAVIPAGPAEDAGEPPG